MFALLPTSRYLSLYRRFKTSASGLDPVGEADSGRPAAGVSLPAHRPTVSRRTSRNDQRVFGVRCGNVETTLDSRTLLSGVRSRRGQGPERGRQTASDGQQNRTRFCDGEEHPFSRSLTDRGGTLRTNACADCAPYGNPLGSCKARRRSRKPRGRSEDVVFRDDERRSLSNHLTSGWVHCGRACFPRALHWSSSTLCWFLPDSVRGSFGLFVGFFLILHGVPFDSLLVSS